MECTHTAAKESLNLAHLQIVSCILHSQIVNYQLVTGVFVGNKAIVDAHIGIDGKQIAAEVKADVAKKVGELKSKGTASKCPSD